MGCPEAMCLITGLQDGSGNGRDVLPTKTAVFHSNRKAAMRRAESELALPAIKFFDTSDGGLLAVRALCTTTTKSVTWRDSRSYMLADSVVAATAGTAATAATRLQVTGWLRGRPMALNSLMHVCGVGAARVVRVSRDRGSAGAAAQQQMGDLGVDGTDYVVADPSK